jgi:hypothetical protein
MRWGRVSRHIFVFEHFSSDNTTILWLDYYFLTSNCLGWFHFRWKCCCDVDVMTFHHELKALVFVQILPSSLVIWCVEHFSLLLHSKVLTSTHLELLNTLHLLNAIALNTFICLATVFKYLFIAVWTRRRKFLIC